MPTRERFKLSLSVFTIVRKDDHLLMLRRANTGWMDGYYSLPAGAHDGGEPVDVAAIRELSEETGLVCTSSSLSLAHTLHCRNEDGEEWIGLFYECREFSGTPQLMEPDKHDRLEWVQITSLPDNTIPYVAHALRRLEMGAQSSTFGW